RAVGIGPDAIGVWSMPDGKEVGAFQGTGPQGKPESFSPDGRLAVSTPYPPNRTYPYPLLVWDVTAGKEVWRLRGHHVLVIATSFTADGKGLLSAGGDG